jgi:hypothetical protein
MNFIVDVQKNRIVLHIPIYLLELRPKSSPLRFIPSSASFDLVFKCPKDLQGELHSRTPDLGVSNGLSSVDNRAGWLFVLLPLQSRYLL